ncbi:MAG: hypothetical protein TU35_006735 [Thermoproteus sp. AZ2]|uniref:Uncharacterized protein n=1 Tax=Thermoproteus sp. AZ2 TaxID=1609232 RepID=A0ACC6V1V5_9CREN
MGADQPIVKRAYIQGVSQRRVRYTFIYSADRPLGELLEGAGAAAEEIASEWGGALCPSKSLPHLGVVLIDWRGASLLADVSLCFPLSRPLGPLPAEFASAKFDKISLCLEPIAPMGKPDGYAVWRVPDVKSWARITLRRNFAVVKHRGLYFLIRTRVEGDPLGGVRIFAGRYGCGSIDAAKALLEARRMLRRRGTIT